MDDAERRSLIRSIRQRVEALGLAGIDRVVISGLPEIRPKRSPSRASVVAQPVVASEPVAPAAAPVVRESPPVRKAPPPAPSKQPVVASTSSLFGESGFDDPVVPAEERPAALAALAAQIAPCQLCPHLAQTRTQTVFGVGNPTARLMFVGEAPGADEDRLGEPFVGKAGQLLTDMITKGMGIRREDVYIANILKCRPPENRQPEPSEMAKCLPYLEKQISIVRPEFLCLLGKTAVTGLLQTVMPMKNLRGKWHRYKGIPTVVTWHPSYLLRTPEAKKDAWEDLQLLMYGMGMKMPERKK